jgi:hypothetical protein
MNPLRPPQMPLLAAQLLFQNLLDCQPGQQAMDENQGLLKLLVGQVAVVEYLVQGLDMLAGALVEGCHGGRMAARLAAGQQDLQPGQIDVVLVMLPHAVDEGVDPVGQAAGAQVRGGDAGDEFLMGDRHHRIEDFLFRPEMMLRRAPGDAGALGDPAGAGCGKPAFLD